MEHPQHSAPSLRNRTSKDPCLNFWYCLNLIFQLNYYLLKKPWTEAFRSLWFVFAVRAFLVHLPFSSRTKNLPLRRSPWLQTSSTWRKRWSEYGSVPQTEREEDQPTQQWQRHQHSYQSNLLSHHTSGTRHANCLPSFITADLTA